MSEASGKVERRNVRNSRLESHPPMRQDQSRGGLTCQECRREDHECVGWKAYIADVYEVLVYCPECAEREFGGESVFLGEDPA